MQWIQDDDQYSTVLKSTAEMQQKEEGAQSSEQSCRIASEKRGAQLKHALLQQILKAKAQKQHCCNAADTG